MYSFRDIEAQPVKAEDLEAGDVIASPALRSETVAVVERLDACRVKITTEFGRKPVVWQLDRWTKVPTLRCSKFKMQPTVAVWEPTYEARKIEAGIRFNPHNRSDMFVLAAASFERRGQGWSFDDLSTECAESVDGLTKAQARSAVRKAAKSHARRLGLDFAETER
ncbi:hypothetical protein K3N28_05155 [Glycomyces sp. TRM65418]|uniref:hypothetical protein n=1 Tax=Glycomyces sp. TRM65418 TaxID=2867006 RepID=UPI001CE68E2D|nr:hypothetical protein [Glycomyces sp. TRM65418]MCC3762456.1 hypothetical protein [Glycomyces sp. TRM65418]QZD56500.1 hypothetical protein K3N28_05115 [Glycomyces sp. TRM65418]